MRVDLPLGARVAAASRLRAARAEVAEVVTRQFLARHPDWVTRYGEAAHRRGLEDAGYHVDFLAGALESGHSEPFEDYAGWTARVLAARGIAATFLIENLDQVGAACESHLDDTARGAVRDILAAGARAAAGPAPEATARDPQALAGSLFLQALLAGDRRVAATVVREELLRGAPAPDIYVGVLQEALYEIGRRWERNEITVAQEHMATAITQYVVSQVFPLLPPAPFQRGRAVITGVQGELHQVGSNMVADMLEVDGWDVHFLGTNIPHDGIVQAVVAHRPDFLGVSCTMLFNLPSVVTLVAAVRARVSPAPRLLLGGAAFRSAPDLWKELGAEGWAQDLRAAITLARGPAPHGGA